MLDALARILTAVFLAGALIVAVILAALAGLAWLVWG